ncbi:MAG: hypothetical protein ABH836_00560 [Candidatus Omnitrophota bacterium]
MGLIRRNQIKNKQAVKRHKKRLKLQKAGLNPGDCYFGKFYVAPKAAR